MNTTQTYIAAPERFPIDPVAVGLQALGWIASDPDRLSRLLGLTGIAPGDLRARATEPSLLAAVLSFLEGHEADLLACADAVGIAPAAIPAAREALEA